MKFRPVGFCNIYGICLTGNRICGIVEGLCHAAGILRGHQVLHHVADGGAYRKLVFRDGDFVMDYADGWFQFTGEIEA